ncbi:flagellar P-ring protein precursor FlgI [Litorimonas taeanensis]|uniref:Flagellar P-ring protein n=1 Tax=Litorimonas taeanensis TaxID=568099 RepID=A0A420WMQ0_9PROT|nr:flagellar basal body P-ring protein FlgI [Litorimonas taeanensis]RKQ72165.1 flagellar P-ring protein precursor FlgI [Litorimonas taeanensis]
MRNLFKAITLLLFAALITMPQLAVANVKIKDIVDIEGVRGNDLVGYGLVIGLDGTGDTIRNSPYTEEALSNLLERLGVNIQGSDFRPNNVAAVLVTASLRPFARVGSKIDINVSSIGDAKSLAGGTLVMTPLNAADGEVYALAQGSVLVSGFKAEGEGASITEGVPTSGTIPNGARIEKEINFDFQSLRKVRLALRSPDFTTAERIETKINQGLGGKHARLMDSGTVELDLSKLSQSPAHIIGKIENYTLKPAQVARVVIDQRSGTIVLDQNVKVSSVAIAQGNLSIKITEDPVVSQPNPFGYGETIQVPRTGISVRDGEPGNIAILDDSVTLPDLVGGLNALGVTPREMIDILKSIKTAGALHAELVLQ